jgi:hypothetical protein
MTLVPAAASKDTAKADARTSGKTTGTMTAAWTDAIDLIRATGQIAITAVTEFPGITKVVRDMTADE